MHALNTVTLRVSENYSKKRFFLDSLIFQVKKKMSSNNEELFQFVCFETPIEGLVEKHQFQESWLPVAERYFASGIRRVILSEKLKLQGDVSQHDFVSKNCWASISAIKGTFPTGLPSPSEKGQIKATQVGVFKLVYGDDDKTREDQSIFKNGFKALTMIPLQGTPTKETVTSYVAHASTLRGFKGSCIYKLDDSCCPAKDWLYSWIIEAFYDSDNAREASVLNDLMQCPTADKKWVISIQKDYMQIPG